MERNKGPADRVFVGPSRTFGGRGHHPKCQHTVQLLALYQARAGVSPASGKVRAEGCEAEWQSGAEEATQSLGHRSPSDNALAPVKKQQPVSSVSLGAWLSF